MDRKLGIYSNITDGASISVKNSGVGCKTSQKLMVQIKTAILLQIEGRSLLKKAIFLVL